jgi:4-hydroxybenzoate polyprenyltransferase
MVYASVASEACSDRPLVVDLHAALIRSNLPVETFFGLLGQSPFHIFKLPLWRPSGRAALRRKLAESIEIDVTALPYDEAVLARIDEAKAQGRPVYLVSAFDERLMRAVAAHLGLSAAWLASDETANSATVDAARLVEKFGAGKFDHIGEGQAGLRSRRAGNSWLRLLRPHQWAKNGLVAVPILTAHQFSPTAILLGLLAAVAFSACASAGYILNDLIDIQADRGHPSKRNRPFANGDVSFRTGAVLWLCCLAFGFGTAALISWEFVIVLAVYVLGTIAYSLELKRRMLLDAVTLAGLYTIRIVGGAVAIDVPMSEWLLAFSMFIFLSLALIKRHSEMAMRFDVGLRDPASRDYKAADLPVITSLAAAAGYCAVIVLSLYISSDAVRALYPHPAILWLACPLVLYWISRMLMLSHRRLINDDPIIFATTDRTSWVTAALIVLLGVLAS